MQKIQAVEYADQEITQTKEFDTTAEAFAWCVAQRGEALEWLDTQLGFQGMTAVELAKLEADARNILVSQLPPKWYEVHGLNENGEAEEIDELLE